MATRVLVPANLSPTLHSAAETTGTLRVLRGATMGTGWCVKLATASPPSLELTHAIQRELELIVAQMSSWEPASELSCYSAAVPGSWHEISPQFAVVLDCALDIARDTDGAFDPTLGALVDLWGFGPIAAFEIPPSAAAIQAAKRRTGWQRLEWDAAQRRLLQPGGLRLDLSAIAKGYAVDRVSACIAAQGISNYLVEIGGELRGHGCKQDGTPWWVALEQPPADAAASGAEPEQTIVALHALSVATSGDYRRFFQHDGRRYHHTLDGHTGAPVVAAPVAVTVLHSDCMRADAYATALTVLGVEQGHDYACQRGLAASFVLRTAAGYEERVTPAFAALRD